MASSKTLEYIQKYKFQILATLAVNIITFSHGHAAAWSAIAIPLLQSKDSPMLTGPITMEEASWIGSLVCAGGFIGCLIFVTVARKFGRKKTLFLVVIPHVCTWLGLMYGNLVWHLYLSRILSGIAAGGLYLIIPNYIADIADNKIRGTLSSTFIFFINGGMLSGYILASYLSYSLFPRVLIGVSAFYVTAIFFLPDTPQYLIEIKNYDKAERALAFYRNFRGGTKEEHAEFNEYFANLRTTIEGCDASEKMALSYRDFLKPNAVKGLSIGFGLMFLNQFSGLYAVMMYTSTIFQMSGSSMDPNTCTIIVGSVQLLGTFLSTNLVDRVGRKILLAISSFGVAIGCTGIGIFSYLCRSQDLSDMSWIAVTSVSFSLLLGSFGMISLPFVVLTEVLPHKVKAGCTLFCLCSLSIMGLAVLKGYPILMVAIGVDGVMWISAGTALVGAILICLFLPETKGKRLEKGDESEYLNML